MLEPLLFTAFWPIVTIGVYAASKTLYRRRPHLLLSPIVLTPGILIGLAVLLHETYSDYIRSTHFLLTLIGPATVAFAVPIYEQRQTIRRYWPALLIGALAGSSAAMLSAWGLASLLSLDGSLRLSLLPRSVSTPFAMVISSDIGGVPDLTAVFVIITGIAGMLLGDLVLRFLPLKSSLSRGALFGMGAHTAGVAKASQIGTEEGTIAGITMVTVGLVNVLAAPLLGMLLR